MPVLLQTLNTCRGARVHSDSWGSSSEGVYDSLAIDFDIFTWNNQDFLPVAAAGNFGAQDADSTVSSPSTSKNCLSVGAFPDSGAGESISLSAHKRATGTSESALGESVGATGICKG